MPKGKSITEIGKEVIENPESETPEEEVVETPTEGVDDIETPDNTDPEDKKNINNPSEEGGEPEEGEPEDISETPEGQEETQPNEGEFATSFDPNNLSNELKPVYKQMQGDYTRKTQEVAKLKGDYDKVMRYVPLLNKVLSNPELVKQVLGINPQTDPKDAVEEIPTDPKAYAEWIKENTLKAWRTEQETREKIRAEQEVVTRDYKDAESVDSRLNSDISFQNIIVGLVAINPDFKSGKINAVQATKDAIAFYDSRQKVLLDAELKKRRESILSKKNVIRDSGSGGNTIPSTNKPASIHDAFKQAENEGFKN